VIYGELSYPNQIMMKLYKKGGNHAAVVAVGSSSSRMDAMDNGKGTMFKTHNDSSHEEEYDDSKLPCLPMPPTITTTKENQTPFFSQYLQRHPPSPVELAESLETGSSLWKLGQEYEDAMEKDGHEHVQEQQQQHQQQQQSKQQKDKVWLDTLEELDLGDLLVNNDNNVTESTTTSRSKRYTVDPKQRTFMYHQAQRAKKKHSNYTERCQIRQTLPAYHYQDDICNVIQSKSVTLLSGDTGCGKSTQVPQYILDSDPNCNIVVTQPRRISAISIAERVAWERCEEVGQMVGYNVRLDSAVSEKTQLLFVTPGVLLRRLQSSPDLLEFTHVIIDEIHERDKYTEFLMIVLREMMSQRRKDLRIILMSATIQTNELREYWNGLGMQQVIPAVGVDGGGGYSDALDDLAPAEICIPGRTFPVQSFYLEDVLAMTGYVNNVHLDGALQDVEEALSNLLASRTAAVHDVDHRHHESKGKGRWKKKKGVVVDSQQQSETVIVSEHSLVCVMCNQGGFHCAEELGSHMGICNGGGDDMDMVALENKVRNIKVCTEYGAKLEGTGDFEEIDGNVYEDDLEDDNVLENEKIPDDNDDDDDDEERFGMHAGKWDGESPFAVADVVETSLKTTLTEEEMLNRYHLMHDDEQVDSALILETIKYIDKASYLDGAILVFLPGWQEISELTILLESTHPFGDKNKFSVLPLHSGIPSKDQRLVFQRPRQGVRKIVLSTNIAETSVTIDDVAFVIDSGRAKEKNYDPHLQTSTLQPMWISKASAKQRRGRAGRTKPGVCFHLFSRRRFASFREFLESELLRTSLEEICLQCKKLKLTPGGPEDDDGIPAFLSAALTPPHPKSVTNALDKLVEIGAMEVDTNDLTRLGHCLSCLSVSPEVGKMVIWSYILGCSKSASSMAVAMSYKSPFIIPPPHMTTSADNARVEISQGSESDQVTILKVLEARDNFVKRNRNNQLYTYCRKNFINVSTLQMIADLRRNISRELLAIGFPDPTHSSSNSAWHNRNETNANLPFLQSTVVAGVYPNVACRQAGTTKFTNHTKRSLKIHFGSINACKGQPLSKKSSRLEFIAYGEMVKGKTMYTLNQTTHLSSVIPIMLLCGNFRVRPYRGGDPVSDVQTATSAAADAMSVLSVDDWICFKCQKDFASGLAILRKRLNSMFHHFVSNPKTFFTSLSDMERETLAVLDDILRSTYQISRR
jgi:HrpA-like helicases